MIAGRRKGKSKTDQKTLSKVVMTATLGKTSTRAFSEMGASAIRCLISRAQWRGGVRGAKVSALLPALGRRLADGVLLLTLALAQSRSLVHDVYPVCTAAGHQC